MIQDRAPHGAPTDFVFRDIALLADNRDALDRYVEHGLPVGDFMRACIDNNLSLAVAHADDTNLTQLPAIVGYLYNECPSRCWGKSGAHDAWVKARSEERRKTNEPNTES